MSHQKTAAPTVCVCDTTPVGRAVMVIAAVNRGYRVVGVCHTPRSALARVLVTRPFAAVFPLEFPDERSGLWLISELCRIPPPRPHIVCVLDRWSQAIAAEAFLAGADTVALRESVPGVLDQLLESSRGPAS